MSNYDRSIISIIEPDFRGKIKLDEIFIEDSESPEALDLTNNVTPTPYKNSSRLGALFPMIVINTHKFSEDELTYMDMSLNSKIPTISVNLRDNDNKFAISPPIDGDVISLYLRPPDIDNQKPIRIDFNIITISSNPRDRSYIIRGQMKIPEFFKEVCKAYPESTSFEHIAQVCEDTGLGFASNEESTDDSMNRICAFDTYETFVNSTVFSAYKNDESFFDWYIDPFYFLCMVNVNKQYSLEDKTEDVNISNSFPTSGLANLGDTEDSIKGSLVLTNLTTMAEKNVFIERYSVKNMSGSTWISNGYKRYGQWLNIAESDIEYQQAFADPLTTKGAEDDYILLKGRKSDGDFYSTMNKYMWLGKQAPTSEGGNVHDSYCYSKVLNHQNLVEINKTTLEVELAGMNFYIYKYMRIPVVIYESNNPKNEGLMRDRNDALGVSNTNSEDSKNSEIGKISASSDSPTDQEGVPKQTDQVKNELLSGYYVVTGIKYKYDPFDYLIKMSLVLSRREWPIPAKNKDV